MQITLTILTLTFILTSLFLYRFYQRKKMRNEIIRLQRLLKISQEKTRLLKKEYEGDYEFRYCPHHYIASALYWSITSDCYLTKQGEFKIDG